MRIDDEIIRRIADAQRRLESLEAQEMRAHFIDKTWDITYKPSLAGRIFMGTPVGHVDWITEDVQALTCPYAVSVLIRMGIAGAGFSAWVRKNGVAAAWGQGGIDSPSDNWISSYVTIGLDENQKFQWKVTNANANLYIDVHGYWR